MNIFDAGDIKINYADQGPSDGPPVVFSNSLGTDLRLWDQVIALLPPELRLIRYDSRGHGLTSCPVGNYFMGDLVGDAARLLDFLSVKDCVFVGLSVGGIVAQGLAAERMDLVRAMVISNTAAKIGTPDIWADRIAAARAGGIEVLADATLDRWFSKSYRESNPALAAWRHMLVRTPLDGYLGCSAAIAETDLHDSTARLRLPTLAIAGSEDGSTPPDLIRETAALIPGSSFHLIRGAGHLPCVEKPQEYAQVLTAFLEQTGHC